jgi:hypothetical protein
MWPRWSSVEDALTDRHRAIAVLRDFHLAHPLGPKLYHVSAKHRPLRRIEQINRQVTTENAV